MSKRNGGEGEGWLRAGWLVEGERRGGKWKRERESD